jgi:hypothetical protein
MGILDQLLEKKDLRIYLDLRIQLLKSMNLSHVKPRRQGRLQDRMYGRLKELRLLKQFLQSNQIKEKAIGMYRDLHTDRSKVVNSSERKEAYEFIPLDEI